MPSGEPSKRSGGNDGRLGARRVAALTGLRGLAASSVVLFHTWLYGAPDAEAVDVGPFHRIFTSIDIGVTFFFTLSGFLLYRGYARALVNGDDLPSVRTFAIARALRIVPAYWAILLLVTVLTRRELFAHPWHFAANAFFLQFWFPSFYPENLARANGAIAIVPSWSLGVEAAFYLSLPFLVWVAARFARRTGRRVAAAFVPIACLTIVAAASIAVEHLLDGGARRVWEANFPIRAGFFACGMAGTTVALLHHRGIVRIRRLSKLSLALGAVVVTAASIKLHHTGRLTTLDYQWPIAAAFSVLLLLILVGNDRGRVQSALGARVIVGAGLASYSIFLVHDPIIRALRSHSLTASSPAGLLLNLCLVGAATAVATFASYRLIEKPCFALRRRLTPAQSPHVDAAPDAADEPVTRDASAGRSAPAPAARRAATD